MVERSPLSRERVLECAVDIADAEGLDAVTMRSIAKELGVKPMSLYHHVANKRAILDGIVDVVFAQIATPRPGGEWRAELHRRATSAREVLGRHPWAVVLMETSTAPGPATLRHHDAVLGTLRAAGFSLVATGHAYALLDAFTYGFAVQEAGLPFTGPEDTAEIAAGFAAQISPEDYPHMTEYAVERVMRPGYDFGDEFDFGLNLLLDALAGLAGQE